MHFKSRFALAVLLTLPLFMAQVALLLLRFQDSYPHDSEWAITLDEFFNISLLLAYYFLWKPVGMIYLLICLSATVWSWYARPSTWKTRVLLVLVSVVILLGITYDIWWYATGQVFEPIE